jgi:hypothetical protein
MPGRIQVVFVVNIEDLALACSLPLGVASRLRCGVSRRHEVGITICRTYCPALRVARMLLSHTGCV